MLDKPFDIGDWIVANGIEGHIDKISFRSTRIKTFSNEIVHMPSSMLTNTYIVNNSDRDSRRIRLNVFLNADTHPDKIKVVRELILQYLSNANTRFIKKEIIRVNLKEITKFGYNIEITCYTPMPKGINEESRYQEVIGIVNEKIAEILYVNEVKLMLDNNKTVVLDDK